MQTSHLKRRLFLYAVALTAVAVGLGFAFHESLLSKIADGWVVEDPLGSSPADAIVVLGGGITLRATAAAALFKSGAASVILVANTQPHKIFHTNDLEVGTLVQQGIPIERIQVFGQNLSSTREEITELKAWAKAHHFRSVIIPTDLFHTRRVHAFGTYMLKSVGCTVIVRPVQTPYYSTQNWWANPHGRLAFRSEIAKLAVYKTLYW